MYKETVIFLVWCFLCRLSIAASTYHPWKRDLLHKCQDQAAPDNTIQSLIREEKHSICNWLLEYDLAITEPTVCPGLAMHIFKLPKDFKGELQAGLYMVDKCAKEEQGIVVESGKCKIVERTDGIVGEIPARDFVWLDDHLQAVNILGICAPPWHGKLSVIPKVSHGSILPPDYAISPRIILHSSTCDGVKDIKIRNLLTNDQAKDLTYDHQYNIVKLLKMNKLEEAEKEMVKLRSSIGSKSPVVDAVMMADTSDEVRNALGQVAQDCEVNTLRYIAISDVCQHMNRIAFQIGPGQLAPDSDISFILINHDRMKSSAGPLCENINVRVFPTINSLNSLCDPLERSNIFPFPRVSEVGRPMNHEGKMVTKIPIHLPLNDGTGFVALELFNNLDYDPCPIDDLIPAGYFITVVVREKYDMKHKDIHSGQFSRYNCYALIMLGLIIMIII